MLPVRLLPYSAGRAGLAYGYKILLCLGEFGQSGICDRALTGREGIWKNITWLSWRC